MNWKKLQKDVYLKKAYLIGKGEDKFWRFIYLGNPELKTIKKSKSKTEIFRFANNHLKIGSGALTKKI